MKFTFRRALWTHRLPSAFTYGVLTIDLQPQCPFRADWRRWCFRWLTLEVWVDYVRVHLA